MVRCKSIEVPTKEVFKMFITVVKKGLACCLIAQVALAGIVRAENEVADATVQADSLTSITAEAPVNIPQHLMEGIEVVGDKVGRDIQDLPTSTAVIDEARMENEPISTIDDVLNRVANVNSEGIAQFGTFSIRGVNNTALLASFNQTNLLSTVFINQVPLGGYTSDYLKPSTWDVRSVEVLRGPQSTLQGPNSMIGAVFFNYNRPDFTTAGKVRGEYGELDTWNLAAYQNIPLVDDVLATRITLETRNSDGGVESAVTGDDDIARIDERMARIQLLFQPSGNEDVAFNFTGMYEKSKTNSQARVTEYGEYRLEDRKNLETFPGKYPAEGWLWALESDIRIDENWKVAAVTGYNNLYVGEFLYDGDLLPFDLLSVVGNLQERMLSQDLRLHYDSARLRGLVGGYYSNSESTSLYDSSGFLPGLGDYSAIFDLAEKVNTMALYVNLDYDILDNITLNGGLRYNYEKRDTNNSTTFNGVVADLDGESDFSQYLPSASLTWRFTDDLHTGLKYAKGYRSGGVAVAPFAQIIQPYGEEYADSYEVFFRSILLDGRLTLNSNIFLIDWSKQQVPVLPPGGLPSFDELIVNAGKTEIKGFELEASAEVTHDLDCFVALGYAHSEFKEFEVYGIDYAGRSLPNAPEWTFSIGADYTHRSGFFAGGSFRWVDETYSQIGVEEATELSTRHVLDAKIGYRQSHWAAYVWGTNLLDDFYETNLYDASAFGVEAYGSVSTPRRLGIGLEAYW